MSDLASYIREKNNIYGLNELPLRSCYNIVRFTEKKNEYGKKYYYCYCYNEDTKEGVNLYSNCYLTQEIDKFREREDSRLKMINFMITKRRVNRYGGILTSVCVAYRTR